MAAVVHLFGTFGVPQLFNSISRSVSHSQDPLVARRDHPRASRVVIFKEAVQKAIELVKR